VSLNSLETFLTGNSPRLLLQDRRSFCPLFPTALSILAIITPWLFRHVI